MPTYTIGDLARIHGDAEPFKDGEIVDGAMTIPPGTIYLGKVRWWKSTNDSGELWCTICEMRVTNYYLAINHHVQTHHKQDQI